MFSKFPRKEFSHDKGISNENLLDVLKHAGVNVAWYDNDTGSKAVADRVDYIDITKLNSPDFCEDGECRDGIFLSRIDDWLNNVESDSVLVLHMIGSHGPAYYKRSSESERLFKPDCRTSELGDCKTEEIQNAYDNSIVATDAFLSQVIDKLEARSDSLSASMLYVSDHGESLGEGGMYLHGSPYIFAPYEQTHVPMLVWMNDSFAKSMTLDVPCLKREATQGGKSHDNLFHSILSMMNISTAVFDPKLDIFGQCRIPLT